MRNRTIAFVALASLAAAPAAAQMVMEAKAALMGLGEGGDPKAVADICRKVLSQNPRSPGNAPCAYLLRMSYEKLGQDPAALIPEYEALASRFPDAPALLYNLGALKLNAGLDSEAEPRFKRVLELRPGHAEAAFNLGLIRHRAAAANPALYREAERYYGLAIRAVPEFAEAYCNLALALEAQGRSNEAGPLMSKAAALKPELTCGSGGALLLKGFGAAVPLITSLVTNMISEFFKDWAQEKIDSYSAVTEVRLGRSQTLRVPRLRARAQYTLTAAQEPTGPVRIQVRKFWTDPEVRYDLSGYMVVDKELSGTSLAARLGRGYKLQFKLGTADTAEAVVKKRFLFFYLPAPKKREPAAAAPREEFSRLETSYMRGDSRPAGTQGLQLRGPAVQQPEPPQDRPALPELKLAIFELTDEVREIYGRRLARLALLRPLIAAGLLKDGEGGNLVAPEPGKLEAGQAKALEEENADRERLLNIFIGQYIEKRNIPFFVRPFMQKEARVVFGTVFRDALALERALEAPPK